MFKIHSDESFCSLWERTKLMFPFTGKIWLFLWLMNSFRRLHDTSQILQALFCGVFLESYRSVASANSYIYYSMYFIHQLLCYFAFAQSRVLEMQPCSSAIATNSNATSQSVFLYVLFFGLSVSVNIKSGNGNWKTWNCSNSGHETL